MRPDTQASVGAVRKVQCDIYIFIYLFFHSFLFAYGGAGAKAGVHAGFRFGPSLEVEEPMM